MRKSVRLFGRSTPVWLIASLLAVTTAAAIFAILMSARVVATAAPEPSLTFGAWDCAHGATSDNLGTVVIGGTAQNPTFTFSGYSNTSIFHCSQRVTNLDAVSAVAYKCNSDALAGQNVLITYDGTCSDTVPMSIAAGGLFDLWIWFDFAPAQPGDSFDIANGVTTSFYYP